MPRDTRLRRNTAYYDLFMLVVRTINEVEKRFFEQLQRNRAQTYYWLQRRFVTVLRPLTGPAPYLLPAGFHLNTPNPVTGRQETTWDIYQSFLHKPYGPGFCLHTAVRHAAEKVR